MSIQEFSSALRNKANASAVSDLQSMQRRLLEYSTKALASKNRMLSAASILSADSEKFRDVGEQQGRTRLVITKESAASLISAFVPGLDPQSGLELYLIFLQQNYGGLKARHFEVYSETGSNIIGKSNRTIGSVLAEEGVKTQATAFRGLDFSHANTLNHIVEFLRTLGAFQGKSAEIAKKEVTALFERGHIYAQTTGRQLLSAGGITEENDLLDRIIKLSVDLDRASSTLSNKPIYSELNAAIQKDFSAGRIFMNIEFQEKYSEGGIGNQDTGKITKGLQIISSLMKLLTAEYDTKKTRLIGIPKIGSVSEAAKSFDNLVVKLDKYTSQMEKVLQGYIADPGKYILDLKSSKTVKEYIASAIANTIKGKAVEPLKIQHNPVTVYSQKSAPQKIASTASLAKSAQEGKKLLAEIKSSVSKAATAQKSASQQVNLSSLQSLINTHLQDVISANMGDGSRKDILNYRTGRFASTVKVERLSQSREGLITIFYSYMKNPYATFSQGGKQSIPTSRDPKLLISRSIREIAAEKVANRLRAVSV